MMAVAPFPDTDSSAGTYITGQTQFGLDKSQITTWRYLPDGSVAPGWPQSWPEFPEGRCFGVAVVADGERLFVVGAYTPGEGTQLDMVVLKYDLNGHLDPDCNLNPDCCPDCFTVTYSTPMIDGDDYPVAAALDGAGGLWIAGVGTGVGTGADYVVWGVSTGTGQTLGGDVLRFDHAARADIPADIAAGVPDVDGDGPPMGGGYFGRPSTQGSFALSLACAPDVDGDGIDDVVVGSRVDGEGNFGAAYVFSGATGARIWRLTSPQPCTGCRFGNLVAGVPDLDGDGRGDLAIYASEPIEPGSLVRGVVYIMSGATGLPMHRFPIYCDALAGVPDLDGDGRGDLLVGWSSGNAEGEPDSSGVVRLVSGSQVNSYGSYCPPNPRVPLRSAFASAEPTI